MRGSARKSKSRSAKETGMPICRFSVTKGSRFDRENILNSFVGPTAQYDNEESKYVIGACGVVRVTTREKMSLKTQDRPGRTQVMAETLTMIERNFEITGDSSMEI